MKNMVTVTMTCPMCGKEHSFQVTEESLNRYETNPNTLIQDICPEWDVDTREKMKTHWCQECINAFFG